MSDQQTAEQINEAMQEPAPFMGAGPDLYVDLFVGIQELDETSGKMVWHDKALIRELTGADEEHLALLEKKEDITYGEYLANVLSRGVVSVGEVPVTGAHVIDRLVLPDRDLLFLHVVKATYGDTRDIRYPCVSCNESNDVTIELDVDFPVRKPDFDPKVGIVVPTRKGDVTLRLPTGYDSASVLTDDKTTPQVNTEMLARCRVWDDQVTYETSYNWALNLGIADRRALTEALVSVEIGPKMGEVNTQCASCGKDMPILLDWVSLLFG